VNQHFIQTVHIRHNTSPLVLPQDAEHDTTLLTRPGNDTLVHKPTMTFRDRIRRAFKSSSSDSSSLGDSSSHKSEKNSKHATWPSNVYAPGEPMPRAKYRAPVKKEHKDKLDAFSWGTAWRRRSQVSEYSPMGSRMPSRRGSLLSRKSFGGKSAKRMSVDGKSTDGRNIGLDNAQTKGRNAARATQLSTEMEAEGDDDVTNGK